MCCFIGAQGTFPDEAVVVPEPGMVWPSCVLCVCVGGAVVRATLVPCVGVVVVVVAVVGATAAAVGAVARGLLQWVAVKWW